MSGTDRPRPQPGALRIGRRASTDQDRDVLFALRASSLKPLVDDWAGDAVERAKFAAAFVAGAYVVCVDVDEPPALPSLAHTTAPPRIAGAVRIERRRHEIFVAELYVHEAKRRRGIAQQILRELVDESLRTDLPVAIHVPPRAQPAIALLKKLGFVPVPSKERGRARFVWRIS
jgi:GNAT superfamily N-acetyltransferase